MKFSYSSEKSEKKLFSEFNNIDPRGYFEETNTLSFFIPTDLASNYRTRGRPPLKRDREYTSPAMLIKSTSYRQLFTAFDEPVNSNQVTKWRPHCLQGCKMLSTGFDTGN